MLRLCSYHLPFLNIGRVFEFVSSYPCPLLCQVENLRANPARVELAIDERELRLVCDLEFGPTKSIRLIGPQRKYAFVKFGYVADALKAMMRSLPTSEKGDGGVLFGDGKRFVFEPRKCDLLALYRDSDEVQRPAKSKDLVEWEAGGCGANVQDYTKECSGGRGSEDDDVTESGERGLETAAYLCAM